MELLVTQPDLASVPLLLVDDEPNNLDLASRALKRAGFEHINLAMNGAEAWAMIDSTRIDPSRQYRLVISDWNMPHMNGLELVRAIRSVRHMPQPRVIMTSVDGGYDRMRTALQSGVDAFMIKPFTVQMLKDKLREVLSSREERRLPNEGVRVR
jgi:two-component system, chemotaxis family, chemotaxis protein CheY